ncbi:MAG: ABC transporter substrate-binding protein [Minisyncoccia bacterium]
MKRLFSFFRKSWLRFSLLEKVVFIFLIFSFVFGLIFLLKISLNKFTIEVPQKGGNLKLGLICRPSLINPVYVSNNDCDRDLIELIFDSLVTVDGKGGTALRLADKIEISPDGKTYTVFLKDNLFWHDGAPFTSEDVVFTVETIQNPKIKSPLRLNWEGIVAEAISKSAIRFNLRNSYEPFINHLSFKILPKHIWANIEPENFALAEYNLKPVGIGPYLFESLEKDKSGRILSYSLLANHNYHLGSPKIDSLVFTFYDSYEDAKQAFLKKEIEGFSPIELEDSNFFQNKKAVRINKIILPGYYAIFYNLKNPIFTREVRNALELAIDKNLLVNEVLKNQVIPLQSIFLPPYSSDQNPIEFSPEKAKEILNKAGYSQEKPLKFKLFVPNIPEAINVSNFLISSWQKTGVEVEPVILETQELTREIIETRNYDALFFGEIIGQSADLYSFWHSSQIESPGLNLSLFKNKTLDQLIEENRSTLNKDKKLENLKKIKEIFGQEKPALFLYNTYYLYLLPNKIKGNSVKISNFASERFADVYNWYIYIQRKLK